jgi:hypothetical protein
MSQDKRWTVTTSTFGQSLEQVADKLRAAGFSVDQVLTEVGVITGTADAKAVERIRAHPDVTDVSEEVVFDVGPPEGNETW